MTRVLRADRAGGAIVTRELGDARAEVAAQWIALAEQRDRQLAALEPQLVELGLQLARRILDEELRLAPERIAALAAPLLARVRRARQVVVRVHPDDRDALAAQLPALRASAELAAAVHIQDDPDLARGDCVVVSDAGALDARIETQLRALGKALGAA